MNINDAYDNIDELQKVKVHRKKLNTKNKKQAEEKSSFGKQYAKKTRKANARRIVNDVMSGVYDGEDDYFNENW